MKTKTSGKPRATLNQVAAKAGVSITTASLVLGGKAEQHRISEETYLRVKQAADELDYAPNLLVRSMQRGRTHILSFFNSFRERSHHDIYMDSLSTAIESAAGQLGYDVLVHCDFNRTPKEMYRFLNGGHADGLLFFAPLPNDPLLPLLRTSRLPTVLINARDSEGVLASVQDDVEAGMREVGDNLMALGHRRIVILVEHGNFRDAEERAALLRHHLCTNGWPDPEIRDLDVVQDYVHECRQVLHELMNRLEPPTAIVCWRDYLAYRLLEACDAEGVSVPDQLSIVGYDGLCWPAATRHTPASIHVDLDALAETAVHLLDHYLSAEIQTIVQSRLPVTLTRGTTLSAPCSAKTNTKGTIQ